MRFGGTLCNDLGSWFGSAAPNPHLFAEISSISGVFPWIRGWSSSHWRWPFLARYHCLTLTLISLFLGGGSPQYNAINLTALDWTQLSKKECLKYGGSLVGKSCKFVPDLALMSFILFFGTYSMTLTLKKFKFSRYFPTKVRTAPTSAGFCPNLSQR